VLAATGGVLTTTAASTGAVGRDSGARCAGCCEIGGGAINRGGTTPTELPHCLQNFAPGFVWVPHFRQNMAFLVRRGHDKRAPECFGPAESTR